MMSTSRRAVDRRCFGGHDHIQFVERQGKGLPKVSSGGGDIARFATEHACRGMRHRQLTIAAVEAGPTLEEPELLSILDSTDSAQEFSDRSTGLPLNPEMVMRARELEMQYMSELKVREDSDRDTCMAETGRPPIPTDWVHIDKRRLDQAPTTGAGWSVERRAGGQRLMWKIGQQRLPQLLGTRHSVCSRA